LTGGGALPWYDGSALARSGVVIVAVNYRLGALGFLSLSPELPGNLAVLDQLTALQWVHAHIADLGGDPSRITVMGQSGGAHNIASLLTLEASRGLFRRAILQSPPLGIGLMPAGEAARRGNALLEALGLDPSSPDLMEQLRAVPVSQLLQAQTQTAQKLGNMSAGDLRPPFTPTELSPHPSMSDFIEAAARAAAERGIEVLIGWTREEANLFLADDPHTAGLQPDALEPLAKRIYGARAPERLEEVTRHRPNGTASQRFLDLVSDDAFRLPSISFARTLAKAGGRVFVYQFDWASPDPRMGACHCLELPFVFDSLGAWTEAALLKGADSETLQTLSKDMMPRWARFIEKGDPGFPRWEGASEPVYHFDAHGRLEPSP
jgi:para-nitrobenzyl esterase